MKQRTFKTSLLKAMAIICFFLSVMMGCSRNPSVMNQLSIQVAQNINGVIVCDKSLLKETITIPLSDLTDGELQILKLDDADEALVKGGSTVISDNYILVKGERSIPYKLFERKTGKFIANIGSYGQGPHEYISVYDQQIDEANNRIYLLPWTATKILVYDLKGNGLDPIPLCYDVPKGKIKVDTKNGTVVVCTLPFPNAQAIVWQQTLDGKLLKSIEPGHLSLPYDYSNEVYSYTDGDVFDFLVFSFKPRSDTLYRYDSSNNRLLPLFTLDYKRQDVSIHAYHSNAKYYLGQIAEPRQIAENTFSTQNHQFFIVDKETLKGSLFILVNDFLGDSEIKWPSFVLNGDYYVRNEDPGNLRDELENTLSTNTNLSPAMREKLTKLKNSITDNDNNYVLFAKLKK